MFDPRRITVFMVAWFAAGCGEEAAPPTPGIEPRPTAGCERESFTPCDVAADACQAAVFSTVACLRGNTDVSRPSSRTITATKYGSEITAASSGEDPVETLAYEDCFVLMHLAEPGGLSVESRTAASTTTVPAFYSSDTKQVTFVVSDDGTKAYQQESAYILLAHEYIHALQDHEHDLSKFITDNATSTDSSLAIRAVIEGEAEVHEDNFLAATWGLDPADLDWDARFKAYKAYAAEGMADIAPILAIWRSFPYEAGGAFVRRRLQAGGMPAVRELFRTPPRSCLTIRTELEPIPVEALAPLPPAGYELLAADSLGAELLYESLSRENAIATTDASSLAADWRGDLVYLYRNVATAQVAVLWRLRFSAETSKNVILQGTPAWQSRIVEGDVIIGRSNDPNGNAVVEALLANASNGITVPASSDGTASAQASKSWRLPRWLHEWPQ